jgi:hypothetical protein
VHPFECGITGDGVPYPYQYHNAPEEGQYAIVTSGIAIDIIVDDGNPRIDEDKIKLHA